MTMTADWFKVDKAGLANLVEGRSKAFILHELVQNAWDEAAMNVNVSIERVGPGLVEVVVEDDNPEGFKNLEHAYTLFASSGKKVDPRQRGRYNLGEKLVLALATEATIETTKGTVSFNATGRHETRVNRERGSVITLEIKMNAGEMHEMIEAGHFLIPPLGVTTTINGSTLAFRSPITSFEAVLPTVIADEAGNLRRTERVTTVLVYDAKGEEAMIYEMGIPIVPTGDRFHVNVQQKVPLNFNRDNVTPAYLRALRVAVLNRTYHLISAEETTETWVRDACGDDNIAPEAVTSVIHARFGETAVTYDPSDAEANKLSVLEGRQIVHGGSLSAGEWSSVRKAGVLPPAGQVTPSPKPYHPDGEPLTLVPQENWTPGMWQVAMFADNIAQELLGRKKLTVHIANDSEWNVVATFGRGAALVINLAKVSSDFFEHGISEDVIDLIIHEFAHHYTGDHLSTQYYDGLTRLGAKMTRLALTQPGLFK